MSQEFVCSIDATVPAPTAESTAKFELTGEVSASVDLASTPPTPARWNESSWDDGSTWGA
jgi:hypothetical protein